MPLYEYRCEACGRTFEIIQKFSDPPPDACTLCGKGPVLRQHSSPAIQFKGSGWYITDYARRGETGIDKRSTEKTRDAKSDAAAADRAGKTEGKTETAAKADAPAKSEAPAATKPSSTTTGTND